MMHDILLAILWYVTLTALGAAALPLSMRAFSRMPEGGILLARPLGWMLTTFIAWQLAFIGLLPFNSLGIGLSLILVFASSVCFLLRKRAWMLRRLKTCWRTAFNGEIITLLVYGFVLFMRRYEPNIDHTEKPMDLMFLSGLINTDQIPPPDPWLYGEIINYHYGGYMLHSVIAKLTGMVPEYAYNLSVAAAAAMAAAVAFTLGRELFGRCRWGAISVACTLFAGNLASVMIAISRTQMPQTLYEWRWSYLWKTSRVIVDSDGETINEFPFFTMVWADLHPHYSNIPFILLFFAITYAIYTALCRMNLMCFLKQEWPLLAVGAASMALLLPTNLFDFPVGALLLAGCAGMAAYVAWSVHQRSLLSASLLKMVIVMPIVGYSLAAPFWLHFVSPLGDKVVQASPHNTTLYQFLLVFGVHTAAVLLYLGLRLPSALAGRSQEELGALGAIAGILFVMLWAWTGHIAAALAPVIAILLLVTALMTATPSSAMSLKSKSLQIEVFCLIACALAWSLIAGCEYIFLKDNYGTARMNTLFKIHFPAWLLMGVALPPLLLRAIQRIPNAPLKYSALGVATVLFALMLAGPAYTVASFWGVKEERIVSLNGLGYMETYNPNHHKIIQWIRDNAAPDAVLMELPGGGYELSSMVSAATGRRSLLGWQNHEYVWRDAKGDQVVGKRYTDIQTALTQSNWSQAKPIFDKYGVDYVVIARPVNQPMQQILPRIIAGAYRDNLEVILREPGPYELYRVPK